MSPVDSLMEFVLHHVWAELYANLVSGLLAQHTCDLLSLAHCASLALRALETVSIRLFTLIFSNLNLQVLMNLPFLFVVYFYVINKIVLNHCNDIDMKSKR